MKMRVPMGKVLHCLKRVPSTRMKELRGRVHHCSIPSWVPSKMKRVPKDKILHCLSSN